MSDVTAPRFRAYSARDLDALLDRCGADAETKLQIRAVAAVLPFRTNQYVVDELIDWDDVHDDPLFRLVFPQPDMLAADELKTVTDLLREEAGPARLAPAVREIRAGLNAHPAGQTDQNVPLWQGQPISGVQHKYEETLLYFPRQGQTCHAYCTYCFRWAQFVGVPELKMAAEKDDADALAAYLRHHTEITDILVTGGDPLIMRTDNLRRALEPFLAPGMEHIRNIRIGTKALTYWPYRFTDDQDADDLLRLFEEVRDRGRHLAVMAHVTHPRELHPEPVRRAVERIRSTGAVIRTQAPLVRSINDDAGVWREMWTRAVALDAVPYYMFVERDTGPRQYFEVPLVRAWQIYREALSSVTGLARTARGPSMSATRGKVVVDGVTEIAGQTALALRYLQARDPEVVGRPFFAQFDPQATWVTDLRPLSPSDAPFLDQTAGARPEDRAVGTTPGPATVTAPAPDVPHRPV
ncbi:lysine 2,3-aminomutase [Streptomyces sp. NPDC126514]|uniref:KamA family radical SAM protein n=1 Tax=Streptomyces sp. NPDC126514 TaxID=3155210 RepID=UPI003319B688